MLRHCGGRVAVATTSSELSALTCRSARAQVSERSRTISPFVNGAGLSRLRSAVPRMNLPLVPDQRRSIAVPSAVRGVRNGDHLMRFNDDIMRPADEAAKRPLRPGAKSLSLRHSTRLLSLGEGAEAVRHLDHGSRIFGSRLDLVGRRPGPRDADRHRVAG